MGTVFYQVNQAEEIAILGKKRLEGEEERVEIGRLLRGHARLSVRDYENLDHQSAEVNLKPGFLGSNFGVNQKSVHKLVKDPLPVAKLGQQVAVIHLVFGLLLEGLHDAHPLVHASEDTLPHLRHRHGQVANKESFTGFHHLVLGLLVLQQHTVDDAVDQQVLKWKLRAHLNALGKLFQNFDRRRQLGQAVHEAHIVEV